jgi:hypothetical protein
MDNLYCTKLFQNIIVQSVLCFCNKGVTMPAMPEPFLQPKFPVLPRWIIWVSIIAGLVIVTLLIAQVTFLGPDYYYAYYNTARIWLDGGRPLYDLTHIDPLWRFYNLPWLLFPLLPFGLLPPTLGQAVWHVLSVLSLAAAIHVYTRPRISPVWVALCLLNLFTVDMLLRGQLDSFILLAVISGWWAIRHQRPYLLGVALIVMAVKPVNLLLTFALFVLAIRNWPLRSWLKTAVIPVVVVVLTTLVVGLEWPIQFLRTYRDNPLIVNLNSSIWRALDILNLPVFPFIIIAIAAVAAFFRLAWHEGLTPRTLSLALATNLLFTNYANGNHYVMLIPAFLYVAQRDWRYALLAFATTLTPLLRYWYGDQAAVFDLGYVSLLWLGVWFLHSTPSKGQIDEYG